MSIDSNTGHGHSAPPAAPERDKARRRRVWLAAAAVAAVALAGGIGVYEATSGPSYTGPAKVAVSSVGDVGEVLVDGQGYALYMFEPDEASAVTCTGGCAGKWPPLDVPQGAEPVVGEGVQKGLLGQLPDENGRPVVTYAGWPLYRYASDNPGEVSGHDVDENGGRWFAVTTTGERAR